MSERLIGVVQSGLLGVGGGSIPGQSCRCSGANPTSARYDAEDAALAWQRTTEFLKRNLRA
jgi:dienelactone hydrolase